MPLAQSRAPSDTAAQTLQDASVLMALDVPRSVHNVQTVPQMTYSAPSPRVEGGQRHSETPQLSGLPKDQSWPWTMITPHPR